MASGNWLTLADLASRTDSMGKQAYIAEMMSQSITAVPDVPQQEANERGGHEFVLRTSIPTGSWRGYNMGVGYSKSTTGKARVGIGSLEGWSQVDQMLAEDSGDVQTFRENEDVAFMEGMGQTMEQTLWYGNTTTNPPEFMGLSPFYNSLTMSQSSQNVVNGGGSGSSNASLWLVGWGPRTIFGAYPRGSQAGLTSDDQGNVVPAYDSLGNPFKAYTMWFRHQLTLVPMDWRYATRCANLDVTTAGLAGPNAPDLFKIMSQMVMKLPTLSKASSGITTSDAPRDPAPGITSVWYCNRTVRFYMDVQGMRNRNVLLTVNDAAGKPQDTFRGIPVKVSDQLLVTEATVS